MNNKVGIEFVAGEMKKIFKEGFNKGIAHQRNKYIICEECGATAKRVDWKEYKQIKKKFNLIGITKPKMTFNKTIISIIIILSIIGIGLFLYLWRMSC